MATLATSLKTLRNQINELAPRRSKVSDGWIGDAKHRTRKSDHNPNSAGVVCALDITHDPVHGIHAGIMADVIRLSGDPRVNYIISEGRIANSGMPWRKYTGANRHDKHFHVSVKQNRGHWDNPAPWVLNMTLNNKPVPALTIPVPAEVPRKLLRRGMMNDNDVVTLQTLLNAWLPSNAQLSTDGDFGPKTEKAVKAFQKAHKLTVDGKVYADSKGETWAALEKGKQPEPDREFMRVTSAGALFDKLQLHYEGRKNKVYIIDGILHAGIGHRLEHSEGFKVGQIVSDKQIDRWYQQDKEVAEARLLKHINVPLNQNQFDAVASIIWNGGDWDDPTDKRDSPLYFKTEHGILATTLNLGDFNKAGKIILALGKKPTATGAVFKGIMNRRTTEYEVFSGQQPKLR